MDTRGIAAIATPPAHASARCSPALIAREPAERRTTIRAWLPPGFLPPQLTVVSTTPSTDIMLARMLGPTPAASPQLGAADVLYWRNDVF